MIRASKTITALFIVLPLLIFPLRANALIPPLMPFGGPVVAVIPCTCMPGAVWTFFTPLFLSAVPMAGPITSIQWGTFRFANYLISVPGVGHKGAYIPGVQACWMYAGFFCFPLPSIGTMVFAGTGLPGSI